jgi:hypothetical protein
MLTIIIVSWNVGALLRGCLKSVIDDTRDVQTKVIVVDSASSDDSREVVRELAHEVSHVQLIACDTNVGYVKGNNLALHEANQQRDEHATEAFFWLLNPDTIVRRGATITLLNFMTAHPNCGMCGPTLRNPDNSLQHGAFGFPGIVQLLIETQPRLARFRNTQLDGRYPSALYEQPQPFQIGHPLGAAMMIRRRAINQVGVLDEGFEMYSEEVDWAKRMANTGWERWCVPSAEVIHYGGASSSQTSVRSELIKWHSRLRYYDKHYSPLKKWIARTIVTAYLKKHNLTQSSPAPGTSIAK